MGGPSAVASNPSPTPHRKPDLLMSTLPKALLALLLVLGLVACGDDDGGDEGGDAEATTTTVAAAPGSGDGTGTSTTAGGADEVADEAAYADALAANLDAGRMADGQLEISAEQAGCAAPEWAAIIGVDAFTEADLTPADVAEPSFTPSEVRLEAEQGEAMVDALVECEIDVYDQYFDVVSDGLDAEQLACLRAEFDDDLARRFLGEALTQREPSAELEETLQAVDETCQLSAG